MKMRLACPRCNKRIGYLRKVLFYSTFHSHECPYCGAYLRIKPLGYIPSIMIVVVLILTYFLLSRWIVIAFCILSLIGDAFLQFYVSDKAP